MRVYLDNCVLNRPFDEPSQVRITDEADAKMVIQRAISQDRVELAISFMLLNGNGRGPNTVARNHNRDFMMGHHKVCVGTDELEDIAPLIGEIMSDGIKMADATHIACAIHSGCDYFVTTDDRLLRSKDPRIRVRTPVEMVCEAEVCR